MRLNLRSHRIGAVLIVASLIAAACSAVGGSPSSSQPNSRVSAGTVAGKIAARATPRSWIERVNRYIAAGPDRMPCATACSTFS